MRGRIFFAAFSALMICAGSGVRPTAFEWPQKDVGAESFSAVFGQFRDGTFSSSLVFAEPAEATASETGVVLAVIGGESGEMGWFDSPLGNAVILAHDDELISVYANLKAMEVDGTAKHVLTGATIGESGSSGWQRGQSSLEFQIIDTQKQAVINPRLLMPVLAQEKAVRLSGITAVGRNGEEYDLRTRRTLPAGSYLVYCAREQNAMPYSTTVSVNGAAVETITFDMLTRQGKELTVMGKRGYSAQDIYPDDSRQLLAEVTLSQGRNTLSISASTISGGESALTYILDIR